MQYVEDIKTRYLVIYISSFKIAITFQRKWTMVVHTTFVVYFGRVFQLIIFASIYYIFNIHDEQFK